MKKLLALILTAFVLVSAVAVSASAYGRRQNAECRTKGSSFIDADSDGICDNKPVTSNCSGAGFTDADNDGVCDNKAATSNCNGTGFTDADNDGICDYRGNGTRRLCGNGKGIHCGRNR